MQSQCVLHGLCVNVCVHCVVRVHKMWVLNGLCDICGICVSVVYGIWNMCVCARSRLCVGDPCNGVSLCV